MFSGFCKFELFQNGRIIEKVKTLFRPRKCVPIWLPSVVVDDFDPFRGTRSLLAAFIHETRCRPGQRRYPHLAKQKTVFARALSRTYFLKTMKHYLEFEFRILMIVNEEVRRRICSLACTACQPNVLDSSPASPTSQPPQIRG